MKERMMILVSHGKLAEGLENAMRMVVGNVRDLLCFGLMPGEDPGQITEKAEALIQEQPETQFLILADIRGGSVSNSITRLTCYNNVRLVNGMNLALAIGLYLLDGVLTDEEIEMAAEDARNGIALVKAETFVEEPDEEII